MAEPPTKPRKGCGLLLVGMLVGLAWVGYLVGWEVLLIGIPAALYAGFDFTIGTGTLGAKLRHRATGFEEETGKTAKKVDLVRLIVAIGVLGGLSGYWLLVKDTEDELYGALGILVAIPTAFLLLELISELIKRRR